MSSAGSPYGYQPPLGAGGMGGGGGGNPYPSPTPLGQKPKVGLAVVCRCAAGNTYVQCLLQRRGQHSSSPNKWSFPGGRLEQPGDLEDDGAVGTKRELNEECGGGAPPGLPPLIHIECCKTGKQNQTLYHVYVVDTSHDKEWESWQPKSRNGRSTTEVDTVVASLMLQNKAFSCTNGYCWVNMGLLIQECYGMTHPDMGGSDLQHGLVRWVQNYGEHILKILMARSPKLHHSRRLSNPISSPPFQNGHVGPGSPRQGPTRQDSGGKPRRFGGGVRVGGGGMLQPPFAHLPYSFHQVGNSQTNSFYNVGIMPNQGQMSPPTGTSTLTTPTNNASGIQGYSGMMMQVPPGLPHPSPHGGGMGQGLMYVPGPPHPFPMVQPPPPLDTPNQHPSSTQPSSPIIPAPPGVGGVAKSEGGGGDGVYLPPHTQNLITTLNPLMATSAVPPPATISAPHPPLNPGGGAVGVASSGQFEQVPGMGHHLPASSSMFPHADSAPIPSNQFPPAHPPLSVNTPLPSPHPPMHPALTHTPGHAPMGESEPLLPNPPIPPVPYLPMVHQIHAQPPISSGNGAPFPNQQTPDSSPLSSRKEILCRHFVQGNCPYGEKCWFAHLEPPGGAGQPPRLEGAGGQGVGMSASPLHVQVPQKFWLGNSMVDYSGIHASPPQSPMNPAFVPRPPVMPAMFRPRGGLPYVNQQPLLFLRGPLPGNPRMPGSNLSLMQPPIPMPFNPILRFVLLSQVELHGVEGQPSPVVDVTQLGTYADHFFVSYGSNINTYRIIFGGTRNYQESAVPTEKKKLDSRVSCLVCSQQQPMLLLVGTEEGNVLLLDMRKGTGHGNITPVYSNENPCPGEAITSLIHFSTSINSAQVVVTGNQSGVLAWHIAQPPQKTFSLLYLDKDTHPPNKIISLQMLGGFLVSGDACGKVAVWSMMSQNPSKHSTAEIHSLSMINLHVVDANHFITVGKDVQRADEEASTSKPPETTPPDDQLNIAPPSAPEEVNLDLSQLSIQSADKESVPPSAPGEPPPQFSIKFWEYGKPPKLIKEVGEVRHVLSSSFHCHNPPGNMFLGLGMVDGMIKIYNVPNFTISSELYFPEMKGKDCIHVRLNLSREAPLITPAYYRNPFRDLILTSLWSDSKIMVCQVAKQ